MPVSPEVQELFELTKKRWKKTQDLLHQRAEDEFYSKPQVFTADEANAKWGNEPNWEPLKPGYMLKFMPDRASKSFNTWLITPQKWEISGDTYKSPEGIPYSGVNLPQLIENMAKQYGYEAANKQFGGILNQPLVPPPEGVTPTEPPPLQPWEEAWNKRIEEGQPAIDQQTAHWKAVQEIFGNVFPQKDLNTFIQAVNEKPEVALQLLRQQGRNQNTEALLKEIGATDEEIDKIFTPPPVEQKKATDIPPKGIQTVINNPDGTTTGITLMPDYSVIHGGLKIGTYNTETGIIEPVSGAHDYFAEHPELPKPVISPEIFGQKIPEIFQKKTTGLTPEEGRIAGWEAIGDLAAQLYSKRYIEDAKDQGMTGWDFLTNELADEKSLLSATLIMSGMGMPGEAMIAPNMKMVIAQLKPEAKAAAIKLGQLGNEIRYGEVGAIGRGAGFAKEIKVGQEITDVAGRKWIVNDISDPSLLGVTASTGKATKIGRGTVVEPPIPQPFEMPATAKAGISQRAEAQMQADKEAFARQEQVAAESAAIMEQGAFWDKLGRSERLRLLNEANLPSAGLDRGMWFQFTPSEKAAVQDALAKRNIILPAKAGEVPPVTAKEPWMMTADEFAKSDYYKSMRSRMKRIKESPGSVQHTLLTRALSEGKPVPPEVLKDYPDLAKQVKPPVAEVPKVTGQDIILSSENTPRKTSTLSGVYLTENRGYAGAYADGNVKTAHERMTQTPQNGVIYKVKYPENAGVGFGDVIDSLEKDDLIKLLKESGVDDTEASRLALNPKEASRHIDPRVASSWMEQQMGYSELVLPELKFSDIIEAQVYKDGKLVETIKGGVKNFDEADDLIVYTGTPYTESINKMPKVTPEGMAQGIKPEVPPPATTPVMPPGTVKAATPEAVGAGIPPPPIKPPEVMTSEYADDVIKRFTQYIHSPESIDLTDLTVQMRKRQLGQRLSAYDNVLKTNLNKGMKFEDANNEALKTTMSGEFARPEKLLNQALADEVRDAAFAKVNDILKDDPIEMISTAEALRNALLGKGIPRELGTKGGSAYTRLSKVFPKEVLETLDKEKPFEKAIEDILLAKSVPGLTTPYAPYSELLKGEQLGLTGVPGALPKALPEIPYTASRQLDFARMQRSAGVLKETPTPYIKYPSEPALTGYRQPPLSTELLLGKPPSFAPGIPDIRTAEEKALDLQTFKTQLKMGAKQPELSIPRYAPPIDTVIKQPSMMPLYNRNKIVEWLKEAGWTTLDIGNALRANQASFDFSWWRQQAPLIMGNLKEFTKSNIYAWRSIWDKKFAETALNDIQKSKYYKLYEDAGYDFLRPLEQKGLPYWKREEQFMVLGGERPIPKFMERLPWVRMSQRSFVTGTNEMNWSIFTKYVDNLIRKNENIAKGIIKLKEGEAFSIEKEIKPLARMLSDMTGRAILGPLKELSPVMNAGLFSLRLNLGRILTARDLISVNPYARKEAWRNLISFVGTITGIELLGEKLGLWEINKSPTSPDFMKLRVGNTRVDPWGGYQQFATLASRLVMRSRISGTTGEKAPTDLLDTLTHFAKGKASPLASMLMDFTSGKNFIGEDLNIKDPKQWINRIAPFAARDIYDAFQSDGAEGLLIGSTTILGAGLGSYPYVRWPEELDVYENIPTNDSEIKLAKQEAKNKGEIFLDRMDWRKINPDSDAKLFVQGNVNSLLSVESADIASKLIKDNGIDPNTIIGVKRRQELLSEQKEKGLPEIEKDTFTDKLLKALGLYGGKAQAAGPEPTPTPTQPGEGVGLVSGRPQLTGVEATNASKLLDMWKKGTDKEKSIIAEDYPLFHRAFPDLYKPWQKEQEEKVTTEKVLGTYKEPISPEKKSLIETVKGLKGYDQQEFILWHKKELEGLPGVPELPKGLTLDILKADRESDRLKGNELAIHARENPKWFEWAKRNNKLPESLKNIDFDKLPTREVAASFDRFNQIKDVRGQRIYLEQDKDLYDWIASNQPGKLTGPLQKEMEKPRDKTIAGLEIEYRKLVTEKDKKDFRRSYPEFDKYATKSKDNGGLGLAPLTDKYGPDLMGARYAYDKLVGSDKRTEARLKDPKLNANLVENGKEKPLPEGLTLEVYKLEQQFNKLPTYGPTRNYFLMDNHVYYKYWLTKSPSHKPILYVIPLSLRPKIAKYDDLTTTKARNQMRIQNRDLNIYLITPQSKGGRGLAPLKGVR